PREERLQRLGERALGVDAVRIDGEAGVLARKALLGPGEPALVAHDVHQIGRIAAVEHAETRVEPDALAMAADEAIGDGMESARPGELHFLHRFAGDA